MTSDGGRPIGARLTGQRVGVYEVRDLLGAGGMGEVYRAWDPRLAREVALKVLPSDVAENPIRRRRFVEEARAAGGLTHPNIVAVFDVGVGEGTPFIATELLDGRDLQQEMVRGVLPIRRLLDLAVQIAAGLNAAHTAGLAHRDLKPQNVMVTRDGRVKILDFGLAKAFGGDRDVTAVDPRTLTVSGVILGTPSYMSPEQATGSQVDFRCDQFSFGLMLYEMATGVHPFRRDTAVQTMSAIVGDEARPIGQVNAAVPTMLRWIIERCLAKNPADRYGSTADLAKDLLNLQGRLGELTGEQARLMPPRSSIAWWITAAAVALSAVLGTLWALPTATPADTHPLANAAFTRLTDFEGDESDAAISRDGTFVAFRSDRDGPMDTWISRIGSGRFVNLTHGTQGSVLIRNTGFTPDGSEVWLSALIGGNRLRLVPLTGGTPRAFLTERTINLSWSPDGSTIAFHTYDTGDPLFVSDATGSNARRIYTLGPGGHVHFPTWSTDGQWIYFVAGIWSARQMDMWRIRPSGGTPERLTTHNADVRFAAPLDARTVLYVAPDQNGAGPWLWSVDVERKVSRRVSSGLERYSSVESSADGRRLVATISNPAANLWTLPLLLDRLTDEHDVQPFKIPSARAFAPRYGGQALFYLSSRGGGDGLWRYADGESTEVWRGADGALLEPGAISRDGQHAAIILRKEGKCALHLLSAGGGDLRSLAPEIDVSGAAGWSPDGGWIAAGGTDSRGPGLFKIPVTGGNPVRLVQGLASNPVWSPDGSVIAYTGPVVGITGPLLLVHPDGTPGETTSIQVRVNGERYRFIPGQQKIVYVPGSQVRPEHFWLFDLTTKSARQLSTVVMTPTRTFDVTPDGKRIVFDRQRENSDIMLIERPK